MSERRFRITEILDGVGGITESEFARRLMIIDWNTTGYKQAIDIILHGDGEKEEEKPWPCPDDIIKMRRGEKGEEPCYVCRQVGNHEPWCSRGKPSPTREEWEAWAHQLSHKLITKIYASHIAQRADVKDSLLSMPIVPKE